MFRSLTFSLSGPCELLFLLCFIVPWNGVVVSVFILCVALLMNLFVLCVACLTVFGETIRNIFWVWVLFCC